MSESKTVNLPVLDPAAMRVTGEMDVDSRLAAPLPGAGAPSLGTFFGTMPDLPEPEPDPTQLRVSKLDRVVKLAREWIAWFDAKGEADEPEQPHEADWARAIVAMAGVCNVVRLELSTVPSRHRRERLGDPRLHRIFDAIESLDVQAGAQPVTPADRLPEPDPAPAYEDDWERDNRIAGTTEDPAHQTASLASGFDLADHARTLERQVEALTVELANARGAIEMLNQAAVNDVAEIRGLEGELTAQEQRTATAIEDRNAYRDRLHAMLGVTRPDGEELLALVERTMVDRMAAIERLRADIATAEKCTAAWQGNVLDRVHAGNDAQQHLADLARPLRRAALMLGADAAGAPIDLAHAIERAAGTLAEQRADGAALTSRLYDLAQRLGARLPEPAERYAEDAVLRIERGLVDLQHAQGKAERSRARWEARARRAERRVAALTEERDGLTLRLGERVRWQACKRKGGR